MIIRTHVTMKPSTKKEEKVVVKEEEPVVIKEKYKVIFPIPKEEIEEEQE